MRIASGAAVASFLLAMGPSPSFAANVRCARQLLHFSDVHLNLSVSLDPRESAAMRMHYFEDAPLVLLQSALAFAQKVAPSPDFFLYTGDHVAHGLFSDEYIAATLEKNVKTIEKFFPPADFGRTDNSEHGGVARVKETTAIIGNADGSAYHVSFLATGRVRATESDRLSHSVCAYVCGYVCASDPDYFMEVTDPNAHTNPSIEKVSKVWSSSLSASNFKAFNRRGYLTYELADKLHVLTLNTVPYSVRRDRRLSLVSSGCV